MKSVHNLYRYHYKALFKLIHDKINLYGIILKHIALSYNQKIIQFMMFHEFMSKLMCKP